MAESRALKHPEGAGYWLLCVCGHSVLIAPSVLCVIGEMMRWMYGGFNKCFPLPNFNISSIWDSFSVFEDN